MYFLKGSRFTIVSAFCSVAIVLLLLVVTISFVAVAAPAKGDCTSQFPTFQPPTNTPNSQSSPTSLTTSTMTPVGNSTQPCGSAVNAQPSTPTLIGSPGTRIPIVREITPTPFVFPTGTSTLPSSQSIKPFAAVATPQGSCQPLPGSLSFNYAAGFPDYSALCFAGNAAPAVSSDGSILRLTSTNPCCQAGAVWYGTKQFVSGGFDTTFTFRITPGSTGTADGFAFVIQNTQPAYANDNGVLVSGGVQAVGDSGCQIGYGGIPYSLAVEFDTFSNYGTGPCGSAQDPTGNNHIAIHQSDPNNPSSFNSNVHQTNPPDWAIPSFMLSDGQVHKIEIKYDGAASGIMHVLVSASPTGVPTEILTKTVNLPPLLDTAGQAWVGFTASTGTTFETHDILTWSYGANTGGVPFPYLITVDSLDDAAAGLSTPTATPNPTSCAPGHAANTCTLREAILDSVNLTTIQFKKNLTGTISLFARLNITDDITIDGSGADVTIGSAVGGGPLAVEPFEILDDVTVTLDQLTFYSCSPIANGGAIWNRGNLTILDSSFILNHANIAGGTIGNASSSGGAIYNDSEGTLTLDHVYFSLNIADTSGGAVASLGTLVVRYSTFHKNTSRGGVASLGYSGSGGAISGSTDNTVSRSAFDANIALSGGGVALGGGTITNSTFSNNVATGIAPGGTQRPRIRGGSAMYGGGTSGTQVKNSTIVYNNTIQNQSQDAVLGNYILINDILAFSGLADTTSNHNPIAGSHSSNCATPVSDQGHNLSSDTSCGFTASSSLSNKNPLLASTPAGTPTYAYGLQTSSPAINHGDNAPCQIYDTTGLGGGTGPYDQRGLGSNRINGGTCDMGSYEFP